MSVPRIAAVTFRKKVNEILNNLDGANAAFNAIDRFNGPSLYFHRRALEETDSHKKMEMTYATLVAWGMHRMGQNGAKMLPFNEFSCSMQDLESSFNDASRLTTENVELQWSLIDEIFRSIRVTANESILVANSKVMAHYLPNVIAPIDRQYTLTFIRGNGNYQNDEEYQRILFERIHRELYFPIVRDQRYLDFYDDLSIDVRNGWYTSKMKGVDNLIIGTAYMNAENL